MENFFSVLLKIFAIFLASSLVVGCSVTQQVGVPKQENNIREIIHDNIKVTAETRLDYKTGRLQCRLYMEPCLKHYYITRYNFISDCKELLVGIPLLGFIWIPFILPMSKKSFYGGAFGLSAALLFPGISVEPSDFFKVCIKKNERCRFGNDSFFKLQVGDNIYDYHIDITTFVDNALKQGENNLKIDILYQDKKVDEFYLDAKKLTLLQQSRTKKTYHKTK